MLLQNLLSGIEQIREDHAAYGMSHILWKSHFKKDHWIGKYSWL
jgi:hypothetical protein